MQKLGQHFLKNAGALQAIVKALEIKKGEVVIEIGPGHGELTMPLLEAVGSGGAVVSIEKDPSLAASLAAFGKKEGMGTLTIIEGDALRLLEDAASGVRHYKIAGNIPYYITGKLLRIVGKLGHRPERTALLIQKEVAERICAAPPAMNRLAASVQFWAKPKVVAFVPRNDFSPPPKVDSAVVVLIDKGRDTSVDPAQYYRAVRGIFAHPRKLLSNNLSSMPGAVGKDKIAARLRKIGIAPSARPQDLGIREVAAIATAALWG